MLSPRPRRTGKRGLAPPPRSQTSRDAGSYAGAKCTEVTLFSTPILNSIRILVWFLWPGRSECLQLSYPVPSKTPNRPCLPLPFTSRQQIKRKRYGVTVLFNPLFVFTTPTIQIFSYSTAPVHFFVCYSIIWHCYYVRNYEVLFGIYPRGLYRAPRTL